ncbi:Putative organic hydroperoxide resistance protein/OsmC-like protein [Mycobacteroides abscessus]|nr:Putative organic hydroperoxide resistance protein/OsmC-like protein [Mycobacteroides abscessus]
MSTLYTAEALVTGEGRDGKGRTSDGRLDLDLAIPKEMGGSGNGTTPNSFSRSATPPASTPHCG